MPGRIGVKTVRNGADHERIVYANEKLAPTTANQEPSEMYDGPIDRGERPRLGWVKLQLPRLHRIQILLQ